MAASGGGYSCLRTLRRECTNYKNGLEAFIFCAYFRDASFPEISRNPDFLQNPKISAFFKMSEKVEKI